MLIIEEGSANFGWGSEVAYQISLAVPDVIVQRIGAKPVPIPSARELESDILVDEIDVINALKSLTRVN